MKTKDDFFLDKMKSVRPIKKKNRIKKEIKKYTKYTTTLTKKEPKESPETKKHSVFNIETGHINKNLKRGRITIDKKIDLHGKTLGQAEKIFVQSIKNNYYENRRCLLFVTGKGLGLGKKNSPTELQKSPKLFYGKIRSAFMDWTKKTSLSKFILSAEIAKPEHGGDGAFCVYLRKKKN